MRVNEGVAGGEVRGTHVSLLLSVVACLSSSVIDHCCCLLLSMQKVAEGEGVTWQQLAGVTMATGCCTY
jgi:hypothetical protein